MNLNQMCVERSPPLMRVFSGAFLHIQDQRFSLRSSCPPEPIPVRNVANTPPGRMLFHPQWNLHSALP
ncbi:MAG: hypothetical protein SFW36_00785 [Leptolyngbyaceae cyanobacterium bins.59]|nr:hypothetical protein [Leptolyngbyaceae cyanobacterium bins.59]